jgi:hypothetical protein
MKSGNLNFLEPSGPLQACNGAANGNYTTDMHVHINPLNAELRVNSICHLLALLGAHHILHVSRIRVKVDLQEVGYGGKNWIDLA